MSNAHPTIVVLVSADQPGPQGLEALASRATIRCTDAAGLESAIELGWLPGITTRVSIAVDTLEEALDAIAAGAVDLVVGDWGADEVGAMRDAIAPRALVERTALAPETAIDEQIQDLERWAEANLARDRRAKWRFWVLRGLAFASAAGAALTANLGHTQPTIAFSVLAALCIAIDAAWPTDSFRNVHQRAVYDLRELQNTLKLRWDKVRLAHPDPAAAQRTAHALALLDQVQSKREEIGKYLGTNEASPGIRRS